MPQTHRKCIWAIPPLAIPAKVGAIWHVTGQEARCDERQGWPIFGRHQFGMGSATIVGQGQFMLIGGIFQPETVWGAFYCGRNSRVCMMLCAVKQLHRTIWIESRHNLTTRLRGIPQGLNGRKWVASGYIEICAILRRKTNSILPNCCDKSKVAPSQSLALWCGFVVLACQ